MHFNEEQLKELETVFGLTRKEETLPVKDGVVTKNTLVWWRADLCPEQVIAKNDWVNIKKYPHLYQLSKPRTKVTYLD